MEIINNYTSFFPSSEGQPREETFPHTLHSPTRLFTMAFEDFKDSEYPLNTLETSPLLLLGTTILLNMVQVLFKVKQPSKNITKSSSSRLDRHEWQGVWDCMGKLLGQLAPPVLWNFIPEQVKNPEILVKHLDKDKSPQRAGAWTMHTEPCSTLSRKRCL